jgi:hypothetical protein
MAKYLDIWEALKKHKICVVAVNPALHERIIHAVINKKYYDEGYKLVLLEKGKRSKLTYKCTKTQIHFTLTESVNFRNLTVEEI